MNCKANIGICRKYTLAVNERKKEQGYNVENKKEDKGGRKNVVCISNTGYCYGCDRT
jgi:hypothetical protein